MFGVNTNYVYVNIQYVSVLHLFVYSQVSPASGLVSILKKRSVCVDNLSVSASSEPRPDKLPAKRRVRFKVPDDSYEHGVFVFIAYTSHISS